jgi:hypothetical protein
MNDCLKRNSSGTGKAERLARLRGFSDWGQPSAKTGPAQPASKRLRPPSLSRGDQLAEASYCTFAGCLSRLA